MSSSSSLEVSPDDAQHLWAKEFVPQLGGLWFALHSFRVMFGWPVEDIDVDQGGARQMWICTS